MEEFDSKRHNNNTSKYHVAVKAMARHPEVCCLLVIICCTFLFKYGYSVQTKSMVIPPRSPSRFFPQNSLITDFPFGVMEPVTNILADNEFIFVMYYAPWCSKSLSGKVDFYKAARAMHGEVRFVSVNCWWAEGECRKRMKLPFFPQFFAYHSNLNGFRYSGLVGAEHMVKFLDELRFPLTYIINAEQLVEFSAAYQNTVIGYFDFGASPEPPGFLQYYYASMRILEQDAAHSPRFAVISSKRLGISLNLKTMSSVAIIRRYNATLKFPSLVKLTSSTLVEWILKHKQMPTVSWIIPSGLKSLQFSSQLETGATLLHMSRVDPLYHLHHTVTMLERMALSYNYCGNKTDVNNSINQTVARGIAASKFFLKIQSMCEEMKQKRKHYSYTRVCCVSVLPRGELNSSQHGTANLCEVCQHYDSFNTHNTGCSMNSVYPNIIIARRPSGNMCAEIVKDYNVNHHTSVCCGLEAKQRTTVSKSENQGRRPTDQFVATGKERAERYECRKLRLHSNEQLPDRLFPVPSSDTSALKSIGLSCNTNKTVTFIIMDSKYQRVFAERLGAQMSNGTEVPPSLTVIIDKQNDWHSIMNESFTENSLDLFLHNYTVSKLNAFHQSQPDPASCDPNAPACVIDLTSDTFHSVVMDNRKDVLVLFYASWCGFCSNLFHVYLALSRYFKSAHNILFTRLNGDRNDLPWEFTVDNYPTMIFFPASRKADSVVFPDVLPKTLPNLIKFVLRHSTQDLRIDTATGICTESCIRRNKREVSNTILEMYQHIRKLKRKIKVVSNSADEMKNKIDTKENLDTQKFRTELVQSQFMFLKRQLSKTEHQVQSAKLLEKLLSESARGLTAKTLEQFQNRHTVLQKNFQKVVDSTENKMRRDEL